MRNHVWAVVSLCILVTLTLVYAGPSKPASQPTVSSTATPMLKVAGMWSLDSGRSSRFDPSGLVWWPATQSFLTVNDKPDEVHVYKIGSPASQPSRNKDGQHVRSLSLLLKSNAVIQRTSPMFPGYRFTFDLEGITACNGHLFVVAEEPRTIIRINPKTKVSTSHTLDVESYYRRSARMRHPMARFSYHSNAGYEGITCDPKAKRLYVIQERQPRYILVVDMPSVWKQGKQLRIHSHFDLPSFSLPRQINGIDSEPDFAGADMDKGFLYVLYRNERLVLKVNPKTHNMLAAYSFRHAEDRLYKQRLPFGLAEGLVVRGNRIYIVMDNNRRPRKLNPTDRRPVLLSFERPKGF